MSKQWRKGPAGAGGRMKASVLGGGPQNYRTPRWFFREVCKVLDITIALDAAADSCNTLAPEYYDANDNGLAKPWISWTWCNPPFSSVGPWARKAVAEYTSPRRAKSLVLTPCSVEARWFRYLTQAPCVSRLDLYPRLNYINPDNGFVVKGNPRTSTLWVVGVDRKSFGYLHAREGQPFSIELYAKGGA